MKKIKIALFGAVMALTALVAGKGAEAATISPAPVSTISKLATGDGGIVQKVHYYGGGYCYRHPYHWRCRPHHVHVYSSCRRWRWECANRWSWHTHGFYRCLRYHGC